MGVGGWRQVGAGEIDLALGCKGSAIDWKLSGGVRKKEESRMTPQVSG